MDYNHIKAAINLLQETAKRLQTMVETTPENVASHQTVYEAMETLKTAVAQMSAGINPPILGHIPQEFLERAEKLGIPLDDIEVRVAIATHHPSQLGGVLAEIENRSEAIRRKREYFLMRISDIPVEQLGSRVPYFKAEDLDWSKEVTPQEVRDALKAKYNIDKLMTKKRSPSTLFERIKQANADLAQTTADIATEEPEDELPF